MTSRELVARACCPACCGLDKGPAFRDLYNRAAVCASDIAVPVSRWLYLCTLPKNYERAVSSGVAIDDNLLSATCDSVVATVEGAHSDLAALRKCVAVCVLSAEAHRPPPFACSLREGVDYFVERGES